MARSEREQAQPDDGRLPAPGSPDPHAGSPPPDRPSGPPESIDRTFGLLAGERPAEGLRRVALSQAEVAIELLDGRTELGQAEAVHETRKAIKRLRAMMRLLEGELGAGLARRERSRLGEIAKSLAGARDAEVMAQTLAELMARHPRKLGRKRALAELGARLERERLEATAQAQADHEARTRALAELERFRWRVQGWQLRDRSAAKLAGPGLERIYRSGRYRRKRALAGKPGARAMHRWRKQVKDLRYALEAIDRPGQARTGGRLAKLAKRADVLGEKLGEEHDLMLLGELARAHRPLKRHRRARKRLLRAIARRRAKLRAQAMREGKRLFERSPKRFVRRAKAASLR